MNRLLTRSAEGLGRDVWAHNEFGGVGLGDKRRTARAWSVARGFRRSIRVPRSTRTRVATWRRSTGSTVTTVVGAHAPAFVERLTIAASAEW